MGLLWDCQTRGGGAGGAGPRKRQDAVGGAGHPVWRDEWAESDGPFKCWKHEDGLYAGSEIGPEPEPSAGGEGEEGERVGAPTENANVNEREASARTRANTAAFHAVRPAGGLFETTPVDQAAAPGTINLFGTPLEPRNKPSPSPQTAVRAALPMVHDRYHSKTQRRSQSSPGQSLGHRRGQTETRPGGADPRKDAQRRTHARRGQGGAGSRGLPALSPVPRPSGPRTRQATTPGGIRYRPRTAYRHQHCRLQEGKGNLDRLGRMEPKMGRPPRPGMAARAPHRGVPARAAGRRAGGRGPRVARVFQPEKQKFEFVPIGQPSHIEPPLSFKGLFDNVPIVNPEREKSLSTTQPPSPSSVDTLSATAPTPTAPAAAPSNNPPPPYIPSGRPARKRQQQNVSVRSAQAEEQLGQGEGGGTNFDGVRRSKRLWTDGGQRREGVNGRDENGVELGVGGWRRCNIFCSFRSILFHRVAQWTCGVLCLEC